MSKSSAPNRLVGYARISTTGQTLDAQLAQLKAQGCALVFKDTASGARADRKELQKMLAVLGGLADVERDLIRTRTAEGRVRAKASTWGTRQNSPKSSARKPSPAAMLARLWRRSPAATMLTA